MDVDVRVQVSCLDDEPRSPEVDLAVLAVAGVTTMVAAGAGSLYVTHLLGVPELGYFGILLSPYVGVRMALMAFNRLDDRARRVRMVDLVVGRDGVSIDGRRVTNTPDIVGGHLMVRDRRYWVDPADQEAVGRALDQLRREHQGRQGRPPPEIAALAKASHEGRPAASDHR